MKPARKTVRSTRRTRDLPPDSEVLELPADCTMLNVDAVHGRLCQISGNVRNITLDLRHLQRFDGTTLQLVAAFARDQGARGNKLLICGTSPAWDEGVQLLGLTAVLPGSA